MPDGSSPRRTRWSTSTCRLRISRRRLSQGEIYPKERIPSAMANFFTSSEPGEAARAHPARAGVADRLQRRSECPATRTRGRRTRSWSASSSRGPNSAPSSAMPRAGRAPQPQLVRGLCAGTSGGSPHHRCRHPAPLSETLTLANQLGATVFTFKGDDIAQTMLRVAKEYRVGHIVIGKPHAVPGWRRVLGKESVAEHCSMPTAI